MRGLEAFACTTCVSRRALWHGELRFARAPGARIRKIAKTLAIETDDGTTAVPLIDASEVAIYSAASMTTPALHELMRREIPVAWRPTGGWLLGHTTGARTKNAATRAAQFAVA